LPSQDVVPSKSFGGVYILVSVLRVSYMHMMVFPRIFREQLILEGYLYNLAAELMR